MCRTIRYIRESRCLLVFVALAACEPASPGGASSDAGESPNASILPAPLANESPDLFDAGPEDPSRQLPFEGLSRPESFQTSAPVPSDASPFSKDAPGVALEAAFRWRDLPAPPRAPEVSADAHRDAAKATALALRIDLAELGRMRMELTGAAFLLPAHTEIRARADHYGNLVVWPGSSGYRVIPPGALRTTLDERRVDVMPLSAGVVTLQGDGRRLGVSVRRVEVTSSIASLRLELGREPESGEGGPLLCRALVELGGVDPRTPLCQAGEVPLLVSYAWKEGGGFTFEVSTLAKRADLGASGLLVPPSAAAQVDAGLPGVPRGILLSRETLASLRTAPLSLPASRDPQVPGEGFVAANRTDRLMVLVLDGIPAVWVSPFGEQYVVGPIRGRYGAQWRSFLGERVGPAQMVEVPGRLDYGAAPDGGVSDGGSP